MRVDVDTRLGPMSVQLNGHEQAGVRATFTMRGREYRFTAHLRRVRGEWSLLQDRWGRTHDAILDPVPESYRATFVDAIAQGLADLPLVTVEAARASERREAIDIEIAELTARLSALTAERSAIT